MNLRAVLVALLVIGASVWIYAWLMPAYSSRQAENELNDMLLNKEDLPRQEWKQAYYRKEAESRTSRNMLLDASSGVTVGSLTMLLFVVAKRQRRFRHLRRLRTVSKIQYFIWFNSGWAVLFVALYWYYMYRGARGDFPSFADSIGIPLMYGETALLWCWPVLNGLLLVAVWSARLPARLFTRAQQYTWLAVAVEIWWGFCLLIATLYTVLTVVDGDHLTIPVALLFVYLVLTLRAGYLQRLNQ